MKKGIISYLDMSILNHFFNYVYENIYCLTIVVDLIPENTMYFTAYFALVKDIAESYGVWAGFAILFFSALFTVISVHQLLGYGLQEFKTYAGGKPWALNPNKFVTSYFFHKFNFFKYFKKK